MFDYMSSLLGMAYGGRPGNFPGISSLGMKSIEGMRPGENESARDFRGRLNSSVGNTMGALGLSGDFANRERQFQDRARNIDASAGNLTNALGGTFRGQTPWSESPDWKVYGRGAYPTGSNPREGAARYYHYSGGGPDPQRMAMFPGNPEMWDRQGSAMPGGSVGGARNIAALNDLSRARFRPGMRRIF